MTETADRILVNGKIWAGLNEGFHEALAIKGDKVLAVGARAEIEALAGDDTEVIDLGGKLATPGLNDNHMHLHMYGFNMKQVDLRARDGVRSVEALLARIAKAAETAQPGEWIIGRGYDHDKLAEGRHPHRRELDAAAPDNPVYIVRACGHVGVASSKALQIAEIGHNTPDPFGGAIGRAEGELTGWLAETAREPVQKAIPSATVDDIVEAIETAGRDLLTYGITSCMEAAIGIRDDMAEMRAYQKAHAEGRLPVRVAGVLMGDLDRNVVDQCYEEGLVTGVGDDMFRIAGVKIFLDGSAGGRTALMSEPYEPETEGAPANYGLQCQTAQQTEDFVMKYHKWGYQVTPHAIGDAAIEQMLVAYEKAYAAHPAEDRRHRIEHCGWLSQSQIDRMAAMGIVPAPQPSFIYFFGNGYEACLGKERPQFCYPMKAFLEAGVHPSASTDCPVCDIDPFANIYAMVTRKTDTGVVLGEDQRLTMAEALHCYTYEAAYGVHAEERKGRLIPGQYADVAVFSKDFFEIDPEEILTTVCDMTLLGGAVVYEREAVSA
ncbi:MAG: amidohydrolase [Albimonas sp.]|uniref:amidohydrolase n=1 Tax=Albimonas sp. TaxID=1872425 RepID=UPI004056C2CE